MDATPSATNPTPEPTPAPKKSPEQVAREVLESHSVKLFRPTPNRFDPRKVTLPDDFFEPTTSELVAASTSLSVHATSLQEAPLQTRKMREDAAKKRMSRFRKVLIRILLPDRVALQGVFKPEDSVRRVRRFLRAALRDARTVRFNLFVTPPKQVLVDLDKTLWSLGLVPAALVHLSVEEGGGEHTGVGLLKDWLIGKLEDAPESIEAAVVPVPAPVPKAGGKGESVKKKGVGKKIPKWFKK